MRTSRPLFTQEMAPLCPKRKARRANVTRSDPRGHKMCSPKLGSCLLSSLAPLTAQSHLHPVPTPGSDGEKGEGSQSRGRAPHLTHFWSSQGLRKKDAIFQLLFKSLLPEAPLDLPSLFSEPLELLSCSRWVSRYAQPRISGCIMTNLRLGFSLNCAALLPASPVAPHRV